MLPELRARRKKNRGKKAVLRNRGFSLVELSIVLVILGLLTGGVLGGRSLIRAAELRAISTEFGEWQVAVNSFKQRFGQYPGDFSQATRFWGASGNCSSSSGPALVGVTCNGNGDGTIAPHADYDWHKEYYLFWHHLSLAGLIQGTYTGRQTTGVTYKHTAGVNCPVSKYTGGGWAIDSDGDHFTNYHFDLESRNAITFGASPAPEVLYSPILTPEDAWGIDRKMDDGKPARGNIIALHNSGCTTRAGGTGATGARCYDCDYKLQTKTVACGLIFRNAF